MSSAATGAGGLQPSASGHRRTGLGVAIVIGALAMACSGAPDTVLGQLMESRRLAAELLVQLTKGADAANRAVMADTDDASVAYAGEARQAAQSVHTDVAALAPMLSTLGYAKENQLLTEFNQRFADYETLDRAILDLAVENTNLKAQRLSFGPAQESADALHDALKSLSPSSASTAARLSGLAATVLASVREIQALQAPHIAESDDATMDRIEARMHAAEASAQEALAALGGLIAPASRPGLADATSAMDRFKEVNGQIISLSRRNSNVRSLALSLGQKRALTAACEDSLRALQDALATRGFTATR